MFGHVLKKISHGLNLLQYKAGEFLFPLLEPFFRLLENRRLETRRHFQQALKSLENKNFNVALVNLNMALSLHPNHFLARVYRARLYVREKRYRFSAEDYVAASKASRFRFIHYDLYREYFASMDPREDEMNSSIIKNFNQAYEMLKLDKDRMSNFSQIGNQVYGDQGGEKSPEDCENVFSMKELTFSERERAKFSKLGPITRKEIEKTDWDTLS